MQHDTPTIFSFKEIFLVTFLGILGTVIWAVHSGQDLGPDLVNYHFYDAYVAFHKERLLTDIFPAGIQGYLNPYIYVLIYSLYKILPPKEVGMIIGALHGLCFISVYLVSRVLLANWSLVSSRLVALVLAAFGLINPFFVAMVGSSFSDNLTPPLILIPLALIMMVRFPDESENKFSRYFYLILFISGFMIGTTVGFKLCNCAYVFGLLAAWLVRFRFSKKDLFGAVILFGAVGIGFLVVEGEWMWRLYSEFHNPMFPFYNHVFKSRMIGKIDTNVPAWAAAHSFTDFIAYPYRWARGIPPVSEWNFADSRYAFIYTIFACILLVRYVVPFRDKVVMLLDKYNSHIDLPHPAFIINRIGFIAAWSIVSYLFWIDQFGALRYLMPVSLLTGLLMLLCLIELVPIRKVALSVWLVFAVISLVTMQPPYFGRVKWRHSWYPVKVPEQLLASKDTLYLKNSLSFMIPFFPDDAHFISIGYFELKGNLINKGRNIVAHHQGPIRTLTLMPVSDASFYDELNASGLRIDPRDCINFMAGVYPFASCRVERISLHDKPILIPLSTVLPFTAPRSSWIKVVTGFYGQEQSGVWTENKTAEIDLLGFLPRKFNLRIDTAYLFGDNAKLPFKIMIGNQKKQFTFPANAKTVTIPFQLNSLTVNKIVIIIPKPTAPHELDPNSSDVRKLGMMLNSLTIEPATT